jgi:CRISPR-associated protein Csm1
MSVQIFLQGKLLGIENFVLAPASGRGEAVLVGRSHWVSLLMEVLPRALLAELGLAKILLGSSGGGGFLVLLPSESIPPAEEFLRQAAREVSTLSGGRLRLIWSSTEDLGDWLVVRRRLAEEMWRRQNTLADAPPADEFEPRDGDLHDAQEDSYFLDFGAKFRDAESVGWSPETPGRVSAGEGKHTWAVRIGADAIPVARHCALADDGSSAATLETLAARAGGRPAWGVLRADVDGFGVRLRRLASIAEHVQLSILFKQFFAGELEVSCSSGDYWRRVTILYAGGDDFAVYGAWDALLMLAREIHRLFSKFAETNLEDLPGPEGKTISMALEVAHDPDTPFAFVYEAAGRQLEAAKCGYKDCLHIFGKTVEWRNISHAAGLKDTLLRMIREFACPPEFLEELGSFYREKPTLTRPDRPWRYHRRLAVVLGHHKDRELQKLRASLITDVIGKSPSQVRLRPAGLVAVAWARMLMEN